MTWSDTGPCLVLEKEELLSNTTTQMNLNSLPRERWCVIMSTCGVTQCVEHSGKGKTIETEDPSVSRKIKKGSRRPEGALWKYASSQLCGGCAVCVLAQSYQS